MLDDRQAESRTSRFARTPLVDAVETLENMADMFAVDAYAVIGEDDAVLIRARIECRDENIAAAGVRDGVVDQIAEYGFDQRGIAAHAERVRQRRAKTHAVVLGQRRHIGGYLVHHRRCVDIAERDDGTALVQTSQGRHIVEQLRQTPALGIAPNKKPIAHLGLDVGCR